MTSPGKRADAEMDARVREVAERARAAGNARPASVMVVRFVAPSPTAKPRRKRRRRVVD